MKEVELIDNGLIKVNCKYYNKILFSDNKRCKISDDNNFDCSRMHCIGSKVTWTYFLINIKHLIEVKDENN